MAGSRGPRGHVNVPPDAFPRLCLCQADRAVSLYLPPDDQARVLQRLAAAHAALPRGVPCREGAREQPFVRARRRLDGDASASHSGLLSSGVLLRSLGSRVRNRTY